MNKKTLMWAAIALAVQAGGASAASIYQESVSGDLDSIGSTNVDLISGINEITGRLEGSPPEDSDRIKFTQVADLVIESIVLSFTSAFDPQGIGTLINLDLHNNVANLFDDNFLSATTGADISASFMDTTGPDTGALSTTTAGAIWDFAINGGPIFPYQDWKLTITTSGRVVGPPPPPGAVPLPAAAPLLLGALGGLVMMRRRRKPA